MLAKAATIIIDVHLDLDDMTPEIGAEVVIDPAFSFLGQTPDILAAWVRGVAKQLDDSGVKDD